MADLTKCPDCGREVAYSASACPGCGRAIVRGGPLLFSIVLVVALCYAIWRFVMG